MHYKFIDIGTCNFGTSIEEHFTPGDKGILVEPIKKYLDALPNYEGLVKVNCAISDYTGKGEMHATVTAIKEPKYIPQEWYQIKDRTLSSQTGKGGCNSLNKPHGWATKANYETEKIECAVITFHDLCNTHNITSADFIKIDTEGHDIIILKQIVERISKGQLSLDKKLVYEKNETPEELLNFFKTEGFNMSLKGENIHLVKNKS